MPDLHHQHESVLRGFIVHDVLEGVVEHHHFAVGEEPLARPGNGDAARALWDGEPCQRRQQVVAPVTVQRAAALGALAGDADEAMRVGHRGLEEPDGAWHVRLGVTQRHELPAVPRGAVPRLGLRLAVASIDCRRVVIHERLRSEQFAELLLRDRRERGQRRLDVGQSREGDPASLWSLQPREDVLREHLLTGLERLRLAWLLGDEVGHPTPIAGQGWRIVEAGYGVGNLLPKFGRIIRGLIHGSLASISGRIYAEEKRGGARRVFFLCHKQAQ